MSEKDPITGRFAPRKEERPDGLGPKSETFAVGIPQMGQPGSEKFHYRVVTVDKDTEEAGREDHHTGINYKTIRKQGRQRIMACPLPEHEERVKEAQRRSVKNATGGAEGDGRPTVVNQDRSRTTVRTTIGRGSNPLYGDEA